MSTIEYIVTFILGVLASLIAAFLFARINGARIKHYLLLGLTFFCFLLSVTILLFVFFKKIEPNLIVIISVAVLNVAALILLSFHIKKGFARKSSELPGSDEILLIFKKESIRNCGEVLGETLGDIARAFNDIKLLFDKSYIRGISDPEYTESIIYPDGLQNYGKTTTHLESQIEGIYKKMIDKSKNHRGVLSTDINMKTGNANHGDYRWICDGLDGGLHFLRDISIFASSIALQRKEGKRWVTIIGAVLVPTTNEFFFAVLDKGAYLNNWDTPLPLKERIDELDKCLFYIEYPNINTRNNENLDTYEECYTFIRNINLKIKKNRNFNACSYALAYLAKGSWDAYISLHGTTSMYDSEAGMLLVMESGKAEDKPTMYVMKEGVKLKNDIDMGSRILATSEKILSCINDDPDLIKSLNRLFPNYKIS
jgi:fructose-1,6-bisphosphatase/inositol monophosphatase family enzyme